MATLFEQQGGQYELQGDYRLHCVTLPNERNYEIGIWVERHRRYLKEHHKVRYYNFLTAGTLDNYLSDIESLISKKNTLISEGKYTDGIDDVYS